MDGITDFKDMSLSTLWATVKDREAWYAAVHGVAELDTIEQLNNKGLSKLSFQGAGIFYFTVSPSTVILEPKKIKISCSSIYNKFFEKKMEIIMLTS